MKRVDTVGSKIEEVIKVLSEKIGVGAEHFWPIFVKQQYVDGLTNVIVWVIPLIVGIILAYSFMKMHNIRKNENDRNDRYDGDWLFAAIIAGAISLFMLVTLLLSLSISIPRIFNPEYYAFKEIMNMIK